jgi:two-component system catabolic regulation response regulator CreB
MRRMPSILFAEDEGAIAETVLYALRADGYVAEHVLLGGEVLPRLRRGGIDLVILDVGLPDRNGFDVCRELRMESEVPVLFLTARDGEADRVLGLELGGDDYVTKPFSPRELVARVRAHLRRSAPADEGWRRLGRFDFDAAGHRIRFDGVLLELTRYESGLLEALLARPGAVLERAKLMDRVWGDALETGERTVDTHVKTVRAKLRAIAPDADPIRTVRGLGYSIHVDG